MLPSILELVNDNFSIIVPGSPYTLGRTQFLLVGLYYFRQIKNPFQYKVFTAFFIMLAGTFLGAFFSDSIGANLLRSTSTMLLLIASLGFASALREKTFSTVLDVIMVASFSYWVIYVFNIVFVGGSLSSYTKEFLEADAINHHIPGITICVALFYLIPRYFVQNQKVKFMGYVLIAIAAISILVLESRSNLIFLIVGNMIMFYWLDPKFSKWILRLIPLFIIAIILLEYFIESSEFLSRRFSLADTEYHENTTIGRRAVYLLFPIEFISTPLGRGILDYRIDVGPVTMNPHNLYITYMLTGGIISVVGVVIFFKYIIRLIRRGGKYLKRISDPRAVMMLNLPTAIYLLTLLTIELGGLYFYLIISMAILGEFGLRRSRKRVFK